LLYEIAVGPLLYAALVAAVFVPLEAFAPLRRNARLRIALRTDVLFATLGAVLTRGALFVLAGATLHATDALALEGPLADLPALVAIPLGLAYFELAGYAYHRLAHRSSFLFRFHAVHHSSTTMDWLAGFRQHPLEIAAMTLVQNLPLVLLGLPLGEHALVVLVLRLNTLFVHSNTRTPCWLGWFVATPRFHHRHHDVEGHRANFATLFPWIDRMFGTFDRRDGERFGLEAAPRPEPGFFALLVAPFRSR
jgi:sterol desaturase/sphingolipid hydroxylase (fatty acid hydroxylase superfamily)